MTDERTSHLDAVLAQLWPAPLRAVVGRPPARDVRVAEFLVLPHRRRPRLLAPLDRRASSAAVRQQGRGRSGPVRFATGVTALALHAGLGTLARRNRVTVAAPAGSAGDGLVHHLAEVLDRPVLVAVALGPPRANRKPVLQVMDPAGRTVAFAKLAVDDLTDDLVQAEGAALADLADTPTRVVEVPRLLHRGSWRGRALLVQTALPVDGARTPLTPARLVAAVADVAGMGRQDGTPLASSEFWATLTDRIARLPAGHQATRLDHLVRRIGERAGGVALSSGAAHGDWAPWNMACRDDRLMVWDWERFRRAVPVGFDLLHHALQTDLVVRAAPAAQAAQATVREAAQRLRPLGVPARPALVTALLYGADLATRYVADRQEEAGAQFGQVGEWLLPALEGGLGLLEGDQR